MRADDNSFRDLTCQEPLHLRPKFDIESVSRGDAIVVEVSGEVDLLTTPAFSEELRRARRKRSEVIIDLEKVEFMDCAALRILVSAPTAAGPGQPRTFLTPGPPQLQRLFRLSGYERLLPFMPPTRSMAA